MMTIFDVVTTFNIISLSITGFNITSFGIMDLIVTLSIRIKGHYAECHYTECR